ncbi:MAG: anti-sigma factor [Rhodospirillales bacterium]|nr:MAG: anti-sigma factor [Rhodospirillales bacterium]
MNGKPYDFDESELHAWVDGQLTEERRAAVEAALAADDGLAARAAAYREQNDEIRALFGATALEPVPRHLQPQRIAARRNRRRWLMPVAASVIWLAAGLAGGWIAHDRLGGGGATVEAARHVASQALSAHRVYAVEVRHPVEVFADEEAHLVKWLSKRLGHDIRVPDLASQGFRLVGGRLLPTADGEPAAQFMYENTGGQRVTVYVSLYHSGQETAFRYQAVQDVGAFIWLEPERGYAVAGDIPREPLLAVSRIVYDTLEAVE